MNLLHLRYAIEVEKTGSITQAADNLFMGQPNLSKAIRELENTLGINIFKRTSKGVVPTEKGQEFLSYARNILMQVEKIETIFSKDSAEKVSYRVAGPRAGYVADAFARFAQEVMMNDPRRLDLQYMETSSLKAINSVVNGESDLAVIRYQQEHESYFTDYLWEKGFQSEVLWEYEYVLLMDKRHPLAAPDRVVNDATLSDCVEIGYSDDIIPYLAQREDLTREEILFDQERGTFRHRIFLYERGSLLDMLTLVPLSMAWSTPLSAEQLERYGLVQRRMTGNPHRHKDLLIYSKKENNLQPLDKHFRDLLRQTCARASVGPVF